MSRRKGARGELEVVKILEDYGITTHRTPNSGGLAWKGDIQGHDTWHIEVKRQERIALQQWVDQAEDDCPKTEVPLVVFRRSHQPWRVVMRFTDFLDITVGDNQ